MLLSVANHQGPCRKRDLVEISGGGGYKSPVDDKSRIKSGGKHRLPARVRRQIAFIFFAALLFDYSSAGAFDIKFEYIVSQSDTIVTELAVIDSLPSKLIEYIDKGVPVSFDYGIELWRARPGWFDKQVDAENVTFKVRYDSWTKNYTVLEIRPDIVVENSLSGLREALDLILTTDRISLPPDDTSGVYYLVGRLAVKVMTLSNFREVESWLKGEISEVDKPDFKDASNKFGEFLFDTALKITGLENVSKDIKTGTFQLKNLPLKFEIKSR